MTEEMGSRRIEIKFESMYSHLVDQGFIPFSQDEDAIREAALVAGYQRDAEKKIFFTEREEWSDADMLKHLKEMGYEYDYMNDAACEMAINEGYAWDEKLKVWYE